MRSSPQCEQGQFPMPASVRCSKIAVHAWFAYSPCGRVCRCRSRRRCPYTTRAGSRAGLPRPADNRALGMTELAQAQEPGEIDAEEAADLLLRDLRSSRHGLSEREAQRRLIQYGPNELRRRGGLQWPGELARQLTHPLALLLWLAAALSFAVGSDTIAIAVLLVIVLNALFAFVQEMQAERAVEALAQFLPSRVSVLRDGAARVDHGRRAGPRRCRGRGGGRSCRGRHAPDLGSRGGGPLHPHGRVDPGTALGRARGHGRPADRGAGSSVQRHQRHRWGGPGCRVRDRDAHRSWVASPHCPSESRRSPARWSGRCAGSRG